MFIARNYCLSEPRRAVKFNGNVTYFKVKVNIEEALWIGKNYWRMPTTVSPG